MEWNDNYKNAVVGVVEHVTDNLVILRCRDPFTDTVTKCFVRNYGDAEILVDSQVIVYLGWIYPFDTGSDLVYDQSNNNNSKGVQ